MKKIVILAVIFCLVTSSFAFTIDELLDGYAKNDTELAELLIKLDQQKISLEKTYIQQGINVNFSAENTSIKFNDGEPVFTTSPKLTLSIPTINSDLSTGVVFDNGDVKSASLDLRTKIIDSVSNNRDLTIEKAERDLELAERKINERLTELQVAFYNDLKLLYSKQNAVTSAQDDLIEEQSNFELYKTQGYAPSSAKYRTQEIAIKTTEWNIEENQRTFITELNNFLIDCGFEANLITEVPLLPDSILSLEIDSINNYDSSTYKNLEETLWTINYANKQAELKNDFTVTADLGFDNTLDSISKERENSISAGLSGKWSGFQLSTSVDVPFEDTKNLKLNLGFVWDLATSKNYSLDKQSDILDAELNELSEQKAYDSLEKKIQSSLTAEKDLAWKKENKLEEAELYKQLYIDTQTWFDRGLVSSSDVLKAKTDYQRALISANESLIDIKIHNLELSQLFIQE